MAGSKKASLPAPIDRPLSRAYLREFAGWSTAFPPGVSDPTSLRRMKNVLINRDGSVRVRPGLRLISQRTIPSEFEPTGPGVGNPVDGYVVGTHEPFYLNDGRRAYLFAYRSNTLNKVIFKLGIYDSGMWEVVGIQNAFDISAWGGQPFFSIGTTYVKYVQIDNKILALSNNGEPAILFEVGASKIVKKVSGLNMPFYDPTGFIDPAIQVIQPTADWVNGSQTGYPSAGALQDNSLISSDGTNNIYNVAFVATVSNDLGETGASNLVSFKVQRPFGSWQWEAAAGTAGQAVQPATGVVVNDGRRSGDQLIITGLGSWLDAAIAAGATSWNIYMMTWSVQAPVPVEMQLVATKKLTPGMNQADDGWVQIHPGSQFLGPSLPIPTVENRRNTSDPSRAGQGIVAADRLVLVNDPTAAAVIRWTTNEQGNYLNFSAARGGGYKTLTSGNLQVPACVKLWQNPQSADTLTILNLGTDGNSTAYYMAPASVTSQSDNTQVMGFEETTATPGTVSPYGCEVANNALFHPLDDQLMKSTASNYNINHKSQTDQIANMWKQLANKKNIVSSFFDQRLYFLVHNPEIGPLSGGFRGNEVWVFDLAATEGNWSRWSVGGVSLRKVSVGGREYMSLTRPEGHFIFDPESSYDDVIEYPEVVQQPIYWELETNTQGANRAHDAWCHLQQVNIVLGNFEGAIRYGIKFMDVNGTWQTVAKKTRIRGSQVHTYPGLPWEFKDFLNVKRDMMEWFFFAEAWYDQESGELQHSAGQISLVQYRYTPASVNVGYEYGSVETFEYGRDVANVGQSTTINGVPYPMVEAPQPYYSQAPGQT